MSKYWEERLLENQYKVGTKRMDKEILKVYQSATKEIQALIADLWLKMLQDGTLTQNGLYQYGRYVQIQEQINQILTGLGQQEINAINAQLTELYASTFAESTQALGGDALGSSFALVDEQVAKEVVNANFKGAVYSDRIWRRQDELKNQLMRVITNSAVVGKDWKTVSKDLAQRLEVGLSDSRRLVRTETMRVLNDACVNSARERGYNTYHVLLESDACDECKSLEDKTFSTTEKVLPVHPHCRCCAIIDIPQENATQNSGTSDIIELQDITIARSLGAAAFRDKIKLPDGSYGKITQGSKITKVVAFAGKGTNKPIKVAKYLSQRYGVPESEWIKVRGDGYVDVNGVSVHAELHWFESQQTGRVKMKVKRWF